MGLSKELGIRNIQDTQNDFIVMPNSWNFNLMKFMIIYDKK